MVKDFGYWSCWTTIVDHGSGWTTAQWLKKKKKEFVHKVGRTTPEGQNPWQIIFYFLPWGGHHGGWFGLPRPVKLSGVDIWRAFSFWTKNLTEVLIWYFSKMKVLVMQIKIQVLKIKVFKTQGPNTYLNLN
jgi:hypothetical protein